MPDAMAPWSCVLFMSVSACRVAGNLEGSGFVRELLSRWSSTREVKAERSEGRLPLRDVEERSLAALVRKAGGRKDERITYRVCSTRLADGLESNADMGFVGRGWLLITLQRNLISSKQRADY